MLNNLFLPDYHPTPQEKLTCLQRELRQRSHVYARLVREGKMSLDLAQREYTTMSAILTDFEQQMQPDLFVATTAGRM